MYHHYDDIKYIKKLLRKNNYMLRVHKTGQLATYGKPIQKQSELKYLSNFRNKIKRDSVIFFKEKMTEKSN